MKTQPHMYCYVAFGFIGLFTNKIHFYLMDYTQLFTPLLLQIIAKELQIYHVYYLCIQYKLIETIYNGLCA